MRSKVTLLALTCAIMLAPPTHASERPVAATLDSTGHRLFVVARDSDQLLVLSTVDGGLVASVGTAPAPSDVVLVGSRNEVWVASSYAEEIRRFDAGDLAGLGSITVPMYSERIVASPSGRHVYATNRASNILLSIDTATLEVNEVELPGRGAARLAVVPGSGGGARTGESWDVPDARIDGDFVVVACTLSESLVVVDVERDTVLADLRVGAAPAALASLGNQILVAHLGREGSVADDAVQNWISVLDVRTGALMGEFEFPWATPRGIASAGNEAVWVAFFGSDIVAKVDPRDGAVLATVPVDAGPAQLVRHDDGRVFVLAEQADSIGVLSGDTLVETWSLTSTPTDTPEARGERVFTQGRAGQPYTCYSCHPNGHLDGLSRFQAPPGYLGSDVINTPTLQMGQWTAPYRRNAEIPSLGLQSAHVLSRMFGEPPDEGELSDLVAYLRTLVLPPNPFSVPEADLTGLAQQGKLVFDSLGCRTCHAGETYLDGKVHDVGTGGDADTTSLLGLWESAPYLHDGRAASLADVFAPLPGRHEPWIPDPNQREALAVYLLTIPNPRLCWSLPDQIVVDDVEAGRVEIQVFSPQTGRPVSGAEVVIEETSSHPGVLIDQPAATNARGETSGMISGAVAGTARIRLLLGGEATEERELQIRAASGLFVDVAAEAGVGFDVPARAYPRAVAIADYNGDGLSDIFVAVSGKDASGAHSGARNYLLKNNGDGTFEDTTAAAGLLRFDRSSAGAAFADYDNDSDLDLFVANRGALAEVSISELYRNDGSGGFTDVAATSGVADNGFGYSVLWFDCDLDGDLDLFTENHPHCSCSEGNLLGDSLYRNDGDGTFTDITAGAGDAEWFDAGGDGGIVGDFDDDGLQDIMKTKVEHGRFDGFQVLKNLGGGLLDEQTAATGLDLRLRASHGMVFADYDNDGDQDMFVVGSGLYRNNGDIPRTFTDVTAGLGFDFSPYRGRRFGHAFADLNNDGWLDLVAENRGDGLAVFINQSGTGQFTPLTDLDLVTDTASDPKVGLGILDYDNDGRLDVFYCREGSGSDIVPQALLANRLPAVGFWLRVTLEGTGPGTPSSANGARIYVDAGELHQVREIRAGEGASGQADYMQHFGLAGNTRVDGVTVVWPDGSTDVFEGLVANQHLLIRQGEATPTVLTTWFDAAIVTSSVVGCGPVEAALGSVVLHGDDSLTYFWDLGDGSVAAGPFVEHTYDVIPAEGVEVALTVSGAGGRLATASTRVFAATPAADVDGDGRVGVADLARLLSAFGADTGEVGFDDAADVDRDGTVGLADLSLLLAEFGVSCR